MVEELGWRGWTYGLVGEKEAYFDRDCFSSVDQFVKDSFLILIPPLHKYGVSLHLFRFSLVSLSRIF